MVKESPTEAEDAQSPKGPHQDLVDRVRAEVKSGNQSIKDNPEAEELEDLDDHFLQVALH